MHDMFICGSLCVPRGRRTVSLVYVCVSSIKTRKQLAYNTLLTRLPRKARMPDGVASHVYIHLRATSNNCRPLQCSASCGNPMNVLSHLYQQSSIFCLPKGKPEFLKTQFSITIQFPGDSLSVPVKVNKNPLLNCLSLQGINYLIC